MKMNGRCEQGLCYSWGELMTAVMVNCLLVIISIPSATAKKTSQSWVTAYLWTQQLLVFLHYQTHLSVSGSSFSPQQILLSASVVVTLWTSYCLLQLAPVFSLVFFAELVLLLEVRAELLLKLPLHLSDCFLRPLSSADAEDNSSRPGSVIMPAWSDDMTIPKDQNKRKK